jgi:CheY-like chemotaxis protein
MTPTKTLLCIHRDPAQLSWLRENGYELITATNGCDGLRLFASRPVDAIVIEYYLAFLDGAVVAGEIKRIRPGVPIVMLTEHLELPEGALNSVDALVEKSDGNHLLLAVVHFWLSVKPALHDDDLPPARTAVPRLNRARGGARSSHAKRSHASQGRKDAVFSPEIWHGIRNGSIQF